MRNSEYVTRFCFVPEYQLGAIGEYLEKMAAKGLIFVGKKGARFRFHKEEPQKLHFSVTVFDKASNFDTRAESDTLDYMEYCKAEGWEYICTDGKVQYFRSTQAEPVPIETDPAAALKQIHRAFWKKTVLRPLLWFLFDFFIFFIPLIVILMVPWVIPIGTICFVSVFCIGMVISLTYLICYLRFYFSNRRRGKRGESIRYGSCRSCVWIAVVPWVVLICGLLAVGIIYRITWLFYSLAICFLIVGIVLCFNDVIDGNRREKRTREENKFLSFMKISVLVLITVCIVPFIVLLVALFPNSEVPYTLEDAGIAVPEESYRNTSAITVRYLLYTENIYDDSYMSYLDEDMLLFGDDFDRIGYTLYSFRNETAPQNWLAWETETEGWVLTEAPDTAAVWQAQSAYYLKGQLYEDDYIIKDEYLIVYNDTVLEISANLLNCPELYGVLTQ